MQSGQTFKHPGRHLIPRSAPHTLYKFKLYGHVDLHLLFGQQTFCLENINIQHRSKPGFHMSPMVGKALKYHQMIVFDH
jgi:hypothetical protein